ncbi:hypothetical protein FRC06_005125 [Ceratobasidium sp. 370]|nr:hypothetical protein FRC06_005125 [Ceratobasidium sp. 370]
MMTAWFIHSPSLRRTFATSLPRKNVNSRSTRDAEASIRHWITRVTTTAPPSDQTDVIDPSRLRLLDLTLPPFGNDAADIPPPPELETPIVPGTEFTFFPPLVRTSDLLPDGTDTTYSSPAPFHRRMWAGGAFAFDPENPLRVGQVISCKTTVEDVELKGWEKARETGELGNDTMVFVKQRREISNDDGVAVVERRTHVYRPEFSGLRPSEVTGKKIMMHSGRSTFLIREPYDSSSHILEQNPPDEQFTFTPSAHTLFRFSALTFNAHRIHLDPIYSSQQEGHEDRLVHGPLTALLLLRFANFLAPSDDHIVAFKYRATHPLVVDRPLTLNLHWTNERKGAEVWATSDKGVVGMKGTVVLADNNKRTSFADSLGVDGVTAGLFFALADS